jgi:hypothetical protein
MSELRAAQMAKSCLSEFKGVLERCNWKVELLGTIESGDGSDFGLIAHDEGGRKLAAGFINGGEDRNQAAIASFSGRAMEADVDMLYLISVPVPTSEESTFARYFNIHLIEADSREALSSKFDEIRTELVLSPELELQTTQ